MREITRDEVERFAKQFQFTHGRMRISLAQMADYINKHFPQFEAKMEDWWGSFDRPIGKLRHEGKYIECKELRVYRRGELFNPVFSHNPREAYRSNPEVARWILEQEITTKQP